MVEVLLLLWLLVVQPGPAAATGPDLLHVARMGSAGIISWIEEPSMLALPGIVS